MRSRFPLLLPLLFLFATGCSEDPTDTTGPLTGATDMRVQTMKDLGDMTQDMKTPLEVRDMRALGDLSKAQDLAQGDMTQALPDLSGMDGDMRAEADMRAEVMDPGVSRDAQGVSVTTMEMALGGKMVPVTLYRPAGQGPFPLLAFHHGFNLDPSLYASYGKHLASWGVLVAMPKMPGSIFSPTPHSSLSVMLLALVEALGASGAANPDKVVLAGHSLGGKIAFLAATTTTMPLRGVFGIDAVDAIPPNQGRPTERYPSVAPELMGGLKVPMVSLGERVNATCSGPFCQACAPENENFAQYYEAATRAPALEAEVKGANHMSFLDDPNCGISCSVCTKGTLDPAVTRTMTRRLLTAFVLVHALDQVAYKGWLGGQDFMGAEMAGEVVLRKKNGF